MFDWLIRVMLSADIGDGGGGGAAGAPTATEGPAGGAGAPTGGEGAAAAVQTPAAAQQPQGPDYSVLSRYGDPETLQRQAEWMNGFYQKYSDPIKQQQFDKWYNGEQQQQAHPYDWMTDEKAMAERRQQGDAHPDHQRLTAEFANFFHNQPGHLAQLANHPKVAEASFQAQAPMIQDLVSRMIQQAVGPVQQHMHQQADQQFRQQYEKPWGALPSNIKQAAQQGRFGDWNNNRQQAVINAVEFAKSLQQQPGVVPPTGQQPPTPTPPKTGQQPPSQAKAPNSNGKRWTDKDEEAKRELAEAMGGKK